MKISMRFLPVLTAAMITLLAACSRVPDGILSPDKMADVMTDIHKGDAVIEVDSRNYRSDSARNILRQSILARHGITQAELDSSIAWYSRNMKLYVEVYDEVLANLDKEIKDERMSSRLTPETPSSTTGMGRRQVQDGDSVNLWPGERAMRFTTGSPSQFVNFYLNSDRGWEPGDSYHLSATAFNLNTPSPRTLVVEYIDGTVEYVFDTPSGSGRHTTDIYLDPDKKASRIFGSIRVAPSAGLPVYLDSISLVRTRQQPGDTALRRGQTVLKNLH